MDVGDVDVWNHVGAGKGMKNNLAHRFNVLPEVRVPSDDDRFVDLEE
jgi:hypothetical protein